MSRSYKKHPGGTFWGASDSVWKTDWHRSYRRKVRELLNQQVNAPEVEFVYPHKNEVGNLWDAPSDGGTHFFHAQTFEQYLERRHKFELAFHLCGLSLAEYKREWITHYKGK